MKLVFNDNTSAHSVDLSASASGKSYRVRIADRTTELSLLNAENGRLEMLVDGRHVSAYVTVDGEKRWVTVNGRTAVLTKASGVTHKTAASDHPGQLTAPMPGQVRAVNVSVGDMVTKGQTLLVVEAMKMEIRVQAPRDGVVKRLFVKEGQPVEREQVLIEIVETSER
ncbi:MAG TPA: biotin/lipoyl-containing protein [Anaerolineales bacterium]|jgi:biotin carboxyl carrier protein